MSSITYEKALANFMYLIMCTKPNITLAMLKATMYIKSKKIALKSSTFHDVLTTLHFVVPKK